MANLHEIELKPGDVIYHPVIDPGVGFAIEEVVVRKLVGPSGHPYGYSHICWSYGDTSFLKDQEIKRDGAGRVFIKRNCFASIKDCLSFLESEKLRFLEVQNDRKEQALTEIVEAKKFLDELKKENVTTTRQINKNLAMLKKLDIKKDLERKGLL